MNPKLAAKCMAELTEDVKYMDESAQEAFAALLPMLAKLYRRDSQTKCVLLLTNESYSTIMHINADEFEAYGLIADAMPKHSALLMRDAPDAGFLN